MKIFSGTLILLALVTLPLASFSDDFFSDDLFFDDMVEELEEAEDTHLDFLITDEVELGGRFSSILQAGASRTGSGDFKEMVIFGAGGNIYMDARPDETLRFFARAEVSYPSENPVTLVEYFADISWKDRVFIRAGKQTVSWSTGGFWSPADILSLEEIDFSDIEAQREGPLALKAAMPIGLHTLDLFIVGDAQKIGFDHLKIVPRAVVHISPGEITLGAGFQPNQPLQLALSASFPLGDVTVIGETMVSFNGDDTVGEGTAGIRWFPDGKDIGVIAQYYYGSILGLPLTGHQGMLMMSLPKVFCDNLSASIRWYSLWDVDISGTFTAGLRYRFFDHLWASGSISAGYGMFDSLSVSAGIEISGIRF